MISLFAAALLAAPAFVLPPSDPQAQTLSDACVAAAERELGEAPPVRSTLNMMKVRREPRDWRVDYDVTLQDRSGRSHQWVGRCTLAAPHVVQVASN